MSEDSNNDVEKIDEKGERNEQSLKKSFASFQQVAIPRKILDAVAPHQLQDCKQMEKPRIVLYIHFPPLNEAVKEQYQNRDLTLLIKIFCSMKEGKTYLGSKDELIAGSKDNPIDMYRGWQ